MTLPSPSSTSCAPWGAADAVFDRLEGAWQLMRTIEGQAEMHGVAVFTREGADSLHYREDGRVRLANGQAFDGHREYRFERAPDGLAVFFAETPPRLFHGIVLAPEGDAWTGAATHLCTPDTYESRYRFLADGRFVIRHTVHGPRKAYVSETVFRRSSV
ncbi:DUF6314 family protein [Variovorax sp. LT1R16]|uniref:DUF6314 family protein n=1 Tax=Variovorax sp. LT1R16 TaxID=3443728 RepID=UPI003F47B803